MIMNNLFGYFDIKCVTHIVGYIKDDNLCLPFNFSKKPNIYEDEKKTVRFTVKCY